MATISDLPRDLLGEILSRVSLTSQSLARSTCKTWNDWLKNQVLFGQKARKDQFLEFMVVDHSVCLLRFDLQGILNDDDELGAGSSVKKISIPNFEVKISQVFHSNGLLLCVLKDDYTNTKLLVWNPYLGQTRLIQTRRDVSASYAFGYDNQGNHKILKIFNEYKGFEIYDFISDSWRVVVDVNLPYYKPLLYHTGLPLKGNTYLPRGGNKELTNFTNNLVCFDFTTERFGQCLPLPYTLEPHSVDLFWVTDEKLATAVLHCVQGTLEIWITTKIEPNAVSWSSFLTLDMRPINGLPYNFLTYPRSFFIDEENKVAVFIDRILKNRPYQIAYIFGKDGYVKSVNINRPRSDHWDRGLLVCSYVPSLVQLQNQPTGRN